MVEVVIEHGGVQREVELAVEDPRACVSDLIRAVDLTAAAPGAGILVGDRFFSSELGLDEIGLYQGALIRINRELPAGAPPRNGPVLAIVGGPDAGGMYPLLRTQVVIGRGDECDVTIRDPSLSRRHCRLTPRPDGSVLVVDLGSSNGTLLGGHEVVKPIVAAPGVLLQVGATEARVLARLPDDRPLAPDPRRRASGGLVLFNRPPRTALPEEPAPLTAPDPPKATARGAAFSILSVLVPLVTAGVLVLTTHDLRFALFSVLSPVMAMGNWLGAKRRTRKDQRSQSREYQAALEDFERELTAAGTQEMAAREQLLPDPAETLRRARGPSTKLWQRRPGHRDFLRLRAGAGDVPWSPPLAKRREDPAPEVAELIVRYRVLKGCPVEVDLSEGGVVGLVGDRTAALALARSLVCQAAVHHGPADLTVAILASGVNSPGWDWAKWLPHTRAASGATRLLAGDRPTSDTLLGELLGEKKGADPGARSRALAEEGASGPTRLYVLDDVSLTEGRRAPARLLLGGAGGPAAGIVIAEREDQLPAVTTTIIELRSNLGDADLRRPQEAMRIENFVIAGVGEASARECARWLAPCEDPEQELAGAGLPQLARLLPLLSMESIDPDAVLEAWGVGLPDPAPSTPIGVGQDGVVELDLVQDGPHALVGGTTGSGKSELLRSLVAGMAARVSPEYLTFVLVDYKGGSAFEECSQLPHVVGMVTDLDGHLGERALKSLEAELAYRERLLRASGAADLPQYRRDGSRLGPLPRLVVVIDEFATLAAELPDFLGALIGIAQRGRSLGVHLILATQRPSGAVNANIRANTNLRIALRVQDGADSDDIIDTPAAASISRSSPGRAYIRQGPGEVLLVQTALSTMAAGDQHAVGIRLTPFAFGPRSKTGTGDGASAAEGATDLVRLIEAVRSAFARGGIAIPRRPFLEMLPKRVELTTLLGRREASDPVPFALADDPEHQRQAPVGWIPQDGHLALFGMTGSGTTTALLAIARSLVEHDSPEECHVYAVDFGNGGLKALSALPHVGEVITANQRESQFRLLRHLRREVDRRRGLSASERASQPRIVVLIDGVGSFLAEHEGLESAETADAFRRVFAEGPAVDILFVVAGDRPGVLPLRLGSLVSQKVLLRLADLSEFSAIGLRTKDLPKFVPGRAIHGPSRLTIQVGHPGEDFESLGAQLRQRWTVARPPGPMPTLPRQLEFADLPGGATIKPSQVELTVGISDDDFGPAVLALHATDHILVAGPARSGKSSALSLIASLVRAADPRAVLVGICDDRSPLYPLEALDAAGTLQQLAHIVRKGLDDERRWIVLVDDAHRVDDAESVLTNAVRAGRPNFHVVAAGRAEDLRSSYGHWTRPLRQSGLGLLLQPDLSMDGDLLGVRLPRRLAVSLVPGRGFLAAHGSSTLVQIALPPSVDKGGSGEPGRSPDGRDLSRQ